MVASLMISQPLIIPAYFTHDFIKSHQHWNFVYGTTAMAEIHMGQSAIGSSYANCYGVATKWRNCKSDASAFFSDIHFERVKQQIDEDIAAIPRDKPIVLFPKLGCGCAMLPTRAPKCYEYLVQELNKIKSETQIDYSLTY